MTQDSRKIYFEVKNATVYLPGLQTKLNERKTNLSKWPESVILQYLFCNVLTQMYIKKLKNITRKGSRMHI